MMIDSVVNPDLFTVAAEAPAEPSSLDKQLLSENPGVGMISPEDWVNIGQELRLSPRELCVSVLIFEGNSRFQIANRIKCAPGTIRTYIDRLFAKLNVADRLGMVLRVMRVHLALLTLSSAPTMSHKDATCMEK